MLGFDDFQKALGGLTDRALKRDPGVWGNYQNLSDATAKQLTGDRLTIQSDPVKLL